jgi:hypothetical protein
MLGADAAEMDQIPVVPEISTIGPASLSSAEDGCNRVIHLHTSPAHCHNLPDEVEVGLVGFI